MRLHFFFTWLICCAQKTLLNYIFSSLALLEVFNFISRLPTPPSPTNQTSPPTFTCRPTPTSAPTPPS